MRRSFTNHQRGLTLVELMISLTLGLILVTAVATCSSTAIATTVKANC